MATVDEKLLSNYIVKGDFVQRQPTRRQSLAAFDVDVNNPLGKGWMGTVYSAVHIASGEEYAIKKLSKRKIAREEAKELIDQEIQINASLEHSNIVKMKECIEDNKYIHIVMEKCETDLLSYLRDQDSGYLQEDDALKHFVQILDAIHYLHERNIYHRDIKPENVLRCADGQVKLCDFGFAAKSSRRRETVCGTAEYMAPEMVRDGRLYSHKIDVWSLGCLLYELLTGRVPFGERDDGEVECATENQCEYHALTHRILQRPVTFPRHVAPTCRYLIHKMLAKEPSHRPTTAELQREPLVLEAHAALDRERCGKLASADAETSLRRSLEEHHIRDCSVEVCRGSGGSECSEARCGSSPETTRAPHTPPVTRSLLLVVTPLKLPGATPVTAGRRLKGRRHASGGDKENAAGRRPPPPPAANTALRSPYNLRRRNPLAKLKVRYR